MARLESTAVGGYFPTPQSVIDVLFDRLVPHKTAAILDPCAGTGQAIIDLSNKIETMNLYTIELESVRFHQLQTNLSTNYKNKGASLHGDAFLTKWDTGKSVDLLFLNPPYDTDKYYKRLEEKFLCRFTSTLCEQGTLLFLVPYYALSASSHTLAQHYDDIQCYRFPDEDWSAYKQVVLVAKKVPSRLSPLDSIVEQVNHWSINPDSIPPLNQLGAIELPVREKYNQGLSYFKLEPLDTKGLLTKYKPWFRTERTGKLTQVAGILTELPVQQLLVRKYPMATPPRPSHTAAGIASGLFNGSKVQPDDPNSELPPLLVKGMFDREYKTIEEKFDKKGNVKSVTQVQQPKLIITVLDLTTDQYHTLDHEDKGDIGLNSMDLLDHYGKSLLTVMEQECPITYDPRKHADEIILAPTVRQPYKAQAHAAKALVKVLRKEDKSAILLGELGSGKSITSLITAKTMGAKHILVICPPHLLASWQDEVKYTLGDVPCYVLDSVVTIDQLATKEGPWVAILSRESAKLGHGWNSVTHSCPKCGSNLPEEDLAGKRSRCNFRQVLVTTALQHIVMNLCYQLVPYLPKDNTIKELLRGRIDRLRQAKFSKVNTNITDNLFYELFHTLVKGNYLGHIFRLCIAFGTTERIRTVVQLLLAMEDPYDWADTSLHALAGDINLLIQVGSVDSVNFKNLKSGWTISIRNHAVKLVNHHIQINDKLIRSDVFKEQFLVEIAKLAEFKLGKQCNEYLFQAVPEPRRYPLAKYIVRKHKKLFDFIIADEIQDASNSDSGQSKSIHRLTGLPIPKILMTGSIMNGYAESLFINLWAVSSEFRKEFDRDDKQIFIDRYGYRKRVLEEKDALTGEVISFGSVTDRVTRSERIVGNAPGVLPLLVLKHLLPISVTLHKADLAIDLPACTQSRDNVIAEGKLYENYMSLKTTIIDRIKADKFNPILSGKLFGQLAELPSYLDRATEDVGNNPDGSFEIRYPESVGGALVAKVNPLPKESLLPKEMWLIRNIKDQLAKGRNVMVFGWHTNLLPRLNRILEKATGLPCPILYATKVPTEKRQDWIDKNIVKKNIRVMIANPVTIQTGLNNLVHFHSEIWMESCQVNAIMYRQAVGRVDRIGQKKPTQILFPVYSNSSQAHLYELLIKKVAISMLTDGLDSESALEMAGMMEQDTLASLSIGKQLFAMFNDHV